MKDLRAFLRESVARSPHSIRVVDAAVDAKFELIAYSARFAERGEHPGLLFTNVRGSDFPCVTNAMASYERMALALDCTVHEIPRIFGSRLREPVAPREIDRDRAPVKDVVIRGTDVDLARLPIPWHNELDGGAYITGGAMIMRDPAGGAYNMGIYRHQVFGPRELGVVYNATHDGALIYQRYRDAGRSAPVAIAIGHHPALLMAAVARLPGIGGEFEAAGALLGEPLDLVRAETSDLLVPAFAEFIIEGEMIAEEREEGPFGEWPGHYLGDGPAPILKVTAITHRRDAIFHDIVPSAREHVLMGAVPRIGSIFRAVQEVVPDVETVNCPAHSRMHCYISLKRRRNVDVKRAAFAAFNTEPDNLRGVVVVDDDIDVFDDGDVMWALGTRFDAARDLTIVRDWNGPGGLLPTSWEYYADGSRTPRSSSAFIIDATKPVPPIPYPPRTRVPAAAVRAVDPANARPLGGDHPLLHSAPPATRR